jgi:hypothetical protein
MTQNRVEASGVVHAPAAVVYAILADYRHGHPAILPRPYFTGLEVEEGGQGAGTIAVAHMNVYGNIQSFRLKVSEPQPGRVLSEVDTNTGMVTTFTVEPRGADQSEVTIATAMPVKNAIAAFFERLITVPIMRRIYHEELKVLARYAQQKR